MRSWPWTLTLTWTLLLVLAAGCVSGPRVALVPETSPVRAGPDLTGRVYTRIEGRWVLGENEVQVPEGWYLVPPSFVEKGGD